MTSTDIVSPNARFTHFGFWVTDIERMADFYQKLFKMHRTDEGYIEGHDIKADLVFLTRDPMVHHQIVLTIPLDLLDLINEKKTSMVHFDFYLEIFPKFYFQVHYLNVGK